jgi:hypothetical protein
MFLPIAPDVRARGILAYRQFLAGLRMEIFTQADELVHAGNAGQSQIFRALAKPMSRHMLALGVVIADGQMFFEILPGIFQAALWFNG